MNSRKSTEGNEGNKDADSLFVPFVDSCSKPLETETERPSDSGHDLSRRSSERRRMTRRWQPRGPAAVRCSAWQSKVHYSIFSGQPRMDANASECGMNIQIASDSRLFAFIRGFRLNLISCRAYIRRTS